MSRLAAHGRMTYLPWILGISGAVATYMLLSARIELAAPLGIACGFVSTLFEKRHGGPVSFEPKDMSPQERKRLLLAIKLLVCGAGCALLLAGLLVPTYLYDRWSDFLSWHPLSGAEPPRALMVYLGAFALGIGLALPTRSEVNS